MPAIADVRKKVISCVVFIPPTAPEEEEESDL